MHAAGAGAGELAAVADVAARLAFETSAITLPLTRDAQATDVVVGATALQRQDASFNIGAAALVPGQGVIAAGEAGGRATVILAGGDEDGTRAAAAAFAGRLPQAWGPDDPTLADVARHVRDVLTEAGVSVEGVSVPAVYVQAGDDSLQRLVVLARLPAPRDVNRARAALTAVRGGAAAAGAGARPAPLSYAGIESVRVRLVAPGVRAVDVDLPRRTARVAAPVPRRPGGANKETLDLSTLYGIEGLLGDADNNLIPDRLDAMLSPGGEGAEGIAALASRIGLESTGLSFPLARPPASLSKPAEEPPLVLVGAGHPLVLDLAKAGKLVLPADPGEGSIQVVKRAFGNKTAIVVTGADARGAARAVQQMAERLPHVWDRGKDRTTIDDVEEDVRRFLSGRSPAGQAATALYKLDWLAAELAGKDLEWVSATVSVEKAADGLDRVVRDSLAGAVRAGRIDVTVENRDVQKARTIFTDERDIPSEVDDFWRLFRTRVLPAVRKRQSAVVEARLSEPPEVRAAIQQAARAELLRAGASEADTSVTVLSAYKQGFSWLTTWCARRSHRSRSTG